MRKPTIGVLERWCPALDQRLPGPLDTKITYRPAGSMAVDDNGNVFITEEAGDVSDVADAINRIFGAGCPALGAIL